MCPFVVPYFCESARKQSEGISVVNHDMDVSAEPEMANLPGSADSFEGSFP